MLIEMEVILLPLLLLLIIIKMRTTTRKRRGWGGGGVLSVSRMLRRSFTSRNRPTTATNISVVQLLSCKGKEESLSSSSSSSSSTSSSSVSSFHGAATRDKDLRNVVTDKRLMSMLIQPLMLMMMTMTTVTSSLTT